MPSVGDLRNRLVALADEGAQGNPAVYALFSHRFSDAGDQIGLRNQLAAMIEGRDSLVASVPEPVMQFATRQLEHFAERMPPRFDLRGASIGNLILTGGYLLERDLDAVLFHCSELLKVLGTVLPIVDADLHLAALLEDGSQAVGQHTITGKETAPITSPIARLDIVGSLDQPHEVQPEASRKVLELIRGADLICYPMGSFFTSVVCNLQPRGVGQAIASARCPKVYIPSTGLDPEQNGLDIGRAAEVLLETLRRDSGPGTPIEDLLNFVLLDPSDEFYALPPRRNRLRQLGAEVLEMDLVSDDRPPRIDPDGLTEILLSLS